ncbi:hypothetical protein jhhlp_005587 [Lomentospora prolificans]|uniref:protein-ribulosamine 3-kinase n=1 Tax=Lomentospora prolificans TaxID=41688 RepID=A0A2N3N3H4_9PEZI|nr:hypothetical protein jhhlp_005587 [Lomentospora prolificans]
MVNFVLYLVAVLFLEVKINCGKIDLTIRMAPGVDSALIEALKLDPKTTRISTHGGSGFASTFRLTTSANGQDVNYFVKTGSGQDSEVMFRGEHASLNAINSAVPNFCPKSFAHGPLSASNRYFLATEFLDLSSSSPAGSGLSLAQKLAKLHTTPAPVPPGRDKPSFGFPVATCCGATVQENGWHDTWASFYGENRLRAILRECKRKGESDGALEDAVNRTIDKVVPRLLDEGHLKGVVPVVIHGDLWSGNHGKGIIGGRGGVEEVVFDPSCVYGHSEYELGIMKMFGGFGGGFWKEYEKLVPKTEPADEFEDRLLLYELYHHLNHTALFGGGYRGSAMSIMKKLISKYGN